MSFLSRKNSRSDTRGDGAGGRRRADSEYDDYGYAPDGYQDDDSWSPDEYFSPEGIKGRWAAGARPGDRSGGRGRGEAREGGHGHDEPGARYDASGSGPQEARGRAGAGAAGGHRDAYQAGSRQRDGYGQDGPYAADDYGTGAYDLTEDDGDDRGERGGGRRRRDRGDRADRADRGDRSDRGERRRRLGRRDRGDDIWPDDDVSDEDYWASVAADRPFRSAGGGLDDDPLQAAADSRPMAAPSGAARAADGASRLLGADRPAGADRPLASDPRIAGEPRVAGEQRTGSGRLGPPPGLRPAAAGQSGYLPGTATPGTHRRHGAGEATGPGGTSSAAMAGSGTGPNALRPAAGPSAARPAAGLAQPGLSQPGPAQPGFTPNPAQHSPAQPSFQPAGTRSAAHQPDRGDRGDWADRTERIERVTSGGYPDPRPASRGQDGRAQNGRGNALWNQDTMSYDSGSYDARGYDAGSYDSGSYDTRNYDSGSYDTRNYDSGSYDTRSYDSGSYDTRSYDSGSYDTRGYGSGGYASQAQGRARRADADDDPLTSKAYSRSALTDTDGRSYRVARRTQVPADRRDAALNEETQTFSMTTGPYQAHPQAATPRYPGYSGQQSGQHPYDRGTAASYPYSGGQPAPSRPAKDDDRHRSARPASQPADGYGADYPGRR